MCEIEDGTSINVWHDIWLDQTTRLGDVVDHIPDNLINLKISDLSNITGDWNLELVTEIISVEYLKRLRDTPPPKAEDGPDRRVWASTKDGLFSIASAYSILVVLILWILTRSGVGFGILIP